MKSNTAADYLGQMLSNPTYARGKAVRDREAAAKAGQQPAAYEPMPSDLVGVPGGTVGQELPRRSVLTGMLATGTSPDAITNLDGDLHDRLSRMVMSAPVDVRRDLKVSSGFRSEAQQDAIYQDALRKYGSEAEARKWAAPPGHSQHNAGKAVDLKFATATAREWMHTNASRFGLSFPLGNEPWHLEAAGGRGQ